MARLLSPDLAWPLVVDFMEREIQNQNGDALPRRLLMNAEMTL